MLRHQPMTKVSCKTKVKTDFFILANVIAPKLWKLKCQWNLTSPTVLHYVQVCLHTSFYYL